MGMSGKHIHVSMAAFGGAQMLAVWCTGGSHVCCIVQWRILQRITRIRVCSEAAKQLDGVGMSPDGCPVHGLPRRVRLYKT
jgi:hypothetical protein